MTIAKKKPEYAWDKGIADLFLTDQIRLLPTRLCRKVATIHDVANLQKAIQGYKAPVGYLVAPTLEEGVGVEAPLRFVPFHAEE